MKRCEQKLGNEKQTELEKRELGKDKWMSPENISDESLGAQRNRARQHHSNLC